MSSGAKAAKRWCSNEHISTAADRSDEDLILDSAIADTISERYFSSLRDKSSFDREDSWSCVIPCFSFFTKDVFFFIEPSRFLKVVGSG